MPKQLGFRMIIVTVALTVFLLPTESARAVQSEGSVEASGASDEKRSSEAARPLDAPVAEEIPGVDYVHFWVIPWANRPESELPPTTYHPEGYGELYSAAQQEAAKQRSDRFQALLEQSSALYEQGFEPTGSPLFYATLSYVQTGSFDRDFWVFQIFSGVLFALGVILLGRISPLKLWVCLVILIALFVLFRPLRVDFFVANINRIQFFWFAAIACLFVNRKTALVGGFLIAYAVLFKLNFIFVPVFILTGIVLGKQFRILWSSLIGLLLGAVCGYLLGEGLTVQEHDWTHWWSYVSGVTQQLYSIEYGNYSIFSLFGGQSKFISAAIAGGSWLALIATSVVGVRRITIETSSESPVVRAKSGLPLWGAAGLLVFLMSSPLVWAHYYLLAIPAIVLLASYCVRKQQNVRFHWPLVALWLAGTCLVAALPVTLFRMSNPYAITMLMQTGVWCLFAATAWVLRIQASPPCPSESKSC